MPLIKLQKRAEIELFDSANWYEEQQKGLSLKFKREVKATLDMIKSNPLLYSDRYGIDFRFAVVKIFPFVIVFWFDENLNTVFVASIFNTKRDPEKLFL